MALVAARLWSFDIFPICNVRLCRRVLRKGFAFPELALNPVPRLRLRLNRRGEASPKKALW